MYELVYEILSFFLLSEFESYVYGLLFHWRVFLVLCKFSNFFCENTLKHLLHTKNLVPFDNRVKVNIHYYLYYWALLFCLTTVGQ